jgi:hypothetical protein
LRRLYVLLALPEGAFLLLWCDVMYVRPVVWRFEHIHLLFRTKLY